MTIFYTFFYNNECILKKNLFNLKKNKPLRNLHEIESNRT